MRRTLLALTTSAVALTALASPAAADTTSDSARGHVRQFSIDVDFSAHANFNGTDPSGRVRITLTNNDPNLVFDGNVTCLNVTGNLATMSGDITSVRGGTSTARSFVVTALDSGKFSNFPDQLGFFVTPTPAPVTGVCPSAFLSPAEGEIVVYDG